MANNPAVSVIMSVYNQKRFIAESIESILNQTFKDLELIIVDDKCTDGTTAILKKYADNDMRITLIFNKKRIGLTMSLNRALGYARGTFVARQDGDDVSAPNRLQKQVTYLKKHPLVAIVGSDYKRLYESSGCTEHFKQPTTDQKIKQCLKQGITPLTAVVFRRNILKTVQGYNEKVKYAQDYEFYCRISERYACANINETLSIRRFHNNNISVRKKVEQRGYVAWVASGAMSKQSFNNFFKRWFVRNSNYEMIRQSFKNDRYADVVKLYTRYVFRYHNIPVDVLYLVASAAKKNNNKALAKKIFTRIVCSSNREELFWGGSFFHLGELALQSGKNKEALRFFKDCKNIIPHHRLAAQYIRKIVNEKDTIAIA